MSEEEMDVFVEAFSRGGFTGPINWYRNITRNWEASADLKQRVDVPCGMIRSNCRQQWVTCKVPRNSGATRIRRQCTVFPGNRWPMGWWMHSRI